MVVNILKTSELYLYRKSAILFLEHAGRDTFVQMWPNALKKTGTMWRYRNKPRPGPVIIVEQKKKPVCKFPCGVCTKSVRFNQKALLCNSCNKWFHLKCIAMDPKTHFDLGSFDEKWFCDGNCGWPFYIISSHLHRVHQWLYVKHW